MSNASTGTSTERSVILTPAHMWGGHTIAARLVADYRFLVSTAKAENRKRDVDVRYEGPAAQAHPAVPQGLRRLRSQHESDRPAHRLHQLPAARADALRLHV